MQRLNTRTFAASEHRSCMQNMKKHHKKNSMYTHTVKYWLHGKSYTISIAWLPFWSICYRSTHFLNKNLKGSGAEAGSWSENPETVQMLSSAGFVLLFYQYVYLHTSIHIKNTGHQDNTTKQLNQEQRSVLRLIFHHLTAVLALFCSLKIHMLRCHNKQHSF